MINSGGDIAGIKKVGGSMSPIPLQLTPMTLSALVIQPAPHPCLIICTTKTQFIVFKNLSHRNSRKKQTFVLGNSGSLFLSISNLTTGLWPDRAAQCIGARPSRVRESMFAFLSSSNAQKRVWPRLHATWSGVISF